MGSRPIACSRRLIDLAPPIARAATWRLTKGMRRVYELEIPLAPGFTTERATQLVEAMAAAEGLAVRLRGTLVRYPGSLHWHLALPTIRGTLEVTYWPARNRLWLSVQAGRRADWIADALPRVQAGLLPASERLEGQSA